MGKKKAKSYERILFLSDLHIPHHTPYLIPYLKLVKKTFKPDKIISLGDEVELNSVSFHEKNPDLPGPGDELKMIHQTIKLLYDIFPEVDVVESNHGSLYYRRAAASMLPKHVIKSYQEILNAPRGWKWHNDMTVYASDGNPIYVCHGQSSDVLRNSKNKSMNYIQGHHHSKFEIRYWANSLNLYWGVTSGCMIDYKSLAFEYGRLMLDKPIIGCTIVINGHPRLIPLILDNNGRWIGRLA